ncbi:MAG: glutathione S-transferase N-terminal domain-containing protein [Halioglobus sp.]
MFDGKYILWGAEHSMFTRKLQSLLNYQRLDYEFKLKSQEAGPSVEARLGTHFIPGLQTPEGWFIHDTTPIGLMLNAKYPDRAIVPTSPVQRIASHLLEDWADEWFGRYAIHTRWCYPDNVQAVAPPFFANFSGKYWADELSEEEIAKALELIPMIRDGFGLRACENRGCGPDQASAIRRDFDQLMRHTDTHFKRYPFLLGNRASLADFSFTGLFKAHFEIDPEPIRWLSDCAPDLRANMAKLFSAQSDGGEWLDDDALPDTLTPFFEHMLNGHHQYLRASRDALAVGEKWCEVDCGNGPVRMRSLKYSEISRCHIRAEIEGLSSSERKAVDAVLGPMGVLETYLLPPL